ncbi:hypothetical protein E4U14_008335, partial [Claviceps sp. LM454 group G7]
QLTAISKRFRRQHTIASPIAPMTIDSTSARFYTLLRLRAGRSRRLTIGSRHWRRGPIKSP